MEENTNSCIRFAYTREEITNALRRQNDELLEHSEEVHSDLEDLLGGKQSVEDFLKAVRANGTGGAAESVKIRLAHRLLFVRERVTENRQLIEHGVFLTGEGRPPMGATACAHLTQEDFDRLIAPVTLPPIVTR